jgi:hypothetical protein
LPEWYWSYFLYYSVQPILDFLRGKACRFIHKVISAWVSYTWESGKGFRWTQLSNMQEEQNLKQKKNDENLYWKTLYTITYIRKTKRKLISFGIPKTKPKQSRPKNPKTKQTKRKTKNNNQIPIKTFRSNLLDKWKCFLIHLLAGPQPRFRKHPFFILETVTPKIHLHIFIHHELVLASFYWCKMTFFLLISIILIITTNMLLSFQCWFKWFTNTGRKKRWGK